MRSSSTPPAWRAVVSKAVAPEWPRRLTRLLAAGTNAEAVRGGAQELGAGVRRASQQLHDEEDLPILVEPLHEAHAVLVCARGLPGQSGRHHGRAGSAGRGRLGTTVGPAPARAGVALSRQPRKRSQPCRAAAARSAACQPGGPAHGALVLAHLSRCAAWRPPPRFDPAKHIARLAARLGLRPGGGAGRPPGQRSTARFPRRPTLAQVAAHAFFMIFTASLSPVVFRVQRRTTPKPPSPTTWPSVNTSLRQTGARLSLQARSDLH